MRVICLVPSLTETLIECGVEVVGRTRFCIHPASCVGDIPKVGGTKGVDWPRCVELRADLVIFDQEENTRAMAQQCPLPWHATKINSIHDVGPELHKLAALVGSKSLRQLGQDWIELAGRPNRAFAGWQSIPGQLEPLSCASNSYSRMEYLIWRDPWMAIGPDTFIHSMLVKLGFAEFMPNHSQPYPELVAGQIGRADTFYLCSSEPYPFARYKKSLLEQDISGAIVDGEVYSWFGIRSYNHLKHHLENQ